MDAGDFHFTGIVHGRNHPVSQYKQQRPLSLQGEDGYSIYHRTPFSIDNGYVNIYWNGLGDKGCGSWLYDRFPHYHIPFISDLLWYYQFKGLPVVTDLERGLYYYRSHGYTLIRFRTTAQVHGD